MENSLIADAEFAGKGYILSTDKQLLDFNVIYSFLNNESYWSKGIPVERLQKAIANSICFGVYHHHQQCGFARVITDTATFAYICDVFITPEYRGRGLSKWLIKSITNHQELQGLRRWSLATADAHGLYGQYGFTPVSKPELWMEIYNPYSLNQ